MTRGDKPATAAAPTVTLEVHGMSCASCAGKVQAALAAVPGVRSARVMLAADRAVVEGEVPAEQLAEIVRRLGYDARPATATRIRERIMARRAARRDEAQAWKKRCFYALFALPVVLYDMLPMAGIALPHAHLVQAVLATVVLLLVAPPFYRAGFRDLLKLRFEMDSMISLGTAIAYLASLFELARGSGHHLYFEDAVAVLAFMTLGRYLEARGKARAAEAVEGLVDVAAPQAHIIRADGNEENVPAEAVQPGDEVVIRPGEQCPVDGVVTDGNAEADEAVLTGESMPISRGPGDRVIAGSHILGGRLRVRAERTGEETALSGILREMERITEKRTRYQNLADRLVRVFMPIVLVVAVGTFAGWWLHTGSIMDAIRPMVAVMVIACPCAIGIAIPVAVSVGSGVAARRGVLIRDAAALDRIPGLRVFALDKTGSVTTAQMRLTATRTAGISEAGAVAMAAAVEAASEHPLARALGEAAGGRVVAAVSEFAAAPGAGVSGRVGGRLVQVGRIDWTDCAPDAADQAWIAGEERAGRTVFAAVYAAGEAVAGENCARAFFSVADTPRPEAAAVIAQLRAAGFHTVLLSGDRPATVAAMAKQLGCDEALAGVLPGDKARIIRELRARFGGGVAMLGDGVNDAPALAEADLGVAMAGASGIAIEAGAATLMRPDLGLLLELLHIGRAIRRKAVGNLFWSVIYNALLIPAAALGFATPMMAAVAMALSDVSVILNALRLWRLPALGKPG